MRCAARKALFTRIYSFPFRVIQDYREDLGADAVRGEEQLLGEGRVVHACVLAAHAQQWRMQPREHV